MAIDAVPINGLNVYVSSYRFTQTGLIRTILYLLTYRAQDEYDTLRHRTRPRYVSVIEKFVDPILKVSRMGFDFELLIHRYVVQLK